MHRRTFTQGMALLAGGAVFHSVAGNGGLKVSSRLLRGPEALSRDFFAARIGQRFALPEYPTQSMVLKAVETAGRQADIEQFHVLFEIERGERLDDGMFRLRGQDTGDFDLFLTHSEAVQGRQRVLATFNLLPVA